MERLSRYADDRYLFVPLDHSVSDGPITDAAGFRTLVTDVCIGGADAIVVHKGRVRQLDPRQLRGAALIVHLSASTVHAVDGNAKVLVGNVEQALALGADAVSVHVNIGSDTESAQLADLGAVVGACDRWRIPLLVMVYPRGPRMTEPVPAEVVAHAVTIAVDLGADIVKTVAVSPADEMADVVAGSPVPVVVAGGAATVSAAELAASALDAGCSGLAVGRRVFRSADPRATVRELADIVHSPHAGPVVRTRPELVGAP